MRCGCKRAALETRRQASASTSWSAAVADCFGESADVSAARRVTHAAAPRAPASPPVASLESRALSSLSAASKMDSP
eukprot:scaffold21431_cov101-Isochrysis_galbana.AAC.2